MKNLANLNSTEWCDIIFENKNQEYGAFVLRQTSWRRHLLAFILIVGATVMVAFIPAIIESVEAKTNTNRRIIIDEAFTITQVDNKHEEILAEALPNTMPEPPKYVKMDKFVAPTIVEDSEVTEADEGMIGMEELTNSNTAIGAFSVKEGSMDEDAVRKTFDNLIIGEGSGKGQEEITTPINIAEIMPQFPGGEAEMYKFIKNNLKYPIVDQEAGTHGRVSIRFVVSKTGEISEVEVLRGISPNCDREAVKVIKSMPKWIPGKQNGNPVPVYYTLPIVFELG